MDIMPDAPGVIIGGILQENPFFVPPISFSLSCGATILVRKSAGMSN